MGSLYNLNSNIGGYSSPMFDENEFSWILKLTEDESPENLAGSSQMNYRDAILGSDLLKEQSESPSSSPERNGGTSSGYGSYNDETSDSKQASSTFLSGEKASPLSADVVNTASSGDLPLSWRIQSEDTNKKTVPIWSHPGVQGGRSLSQMVPAGLKYSLIPPPKAQIARDEAFFYLVSEPGKLGLYSGPSSPISLKAAAVHSSGLVHPVELQQLELLDGIRCSFYPIYAGRYSARISRSTNEVSNMALNNPNAATNITNVNALVCPPMQLNVVRNYSADAVVHNGASICLEPNDEKYWGLSIDMFSSRFLASDRKENEVLIIDIETGRVIQRFGQQPYSSNHGRLFRPTGIAVDEVNKRVVIADKDNHRVAFYSFDGYYISSFGKKGHGAGDFNYPWDVDVSPSGDHIVVSDSRNHRVQLFDRFGNYMKRYSVFEADPFDYKGVLDYPRGVTFSNDGKAIYTTDFNSNNVLRVDMLSWEARLLVPTGKMSRPQGIISDEMGNLIVCDSRRNCLRVMNSDGNLLTSISQLGTTALSVPVDVCLMRGDQIAFIDISGCIHIL